MVKQVLIAIDQLLNALLFGWADETFSSRCWRTRSVLVPVIDRLFFWDRNHCYASYVAERRRLHSPPEER